MDNGEAGSGVNLREILGDKEYARLMKSQERVRRDQAMMEARREMYAADEAREASLRGYPIGSDSAQARATQRAEAGGKFLLVVLPVALILGVFLWAAVTTW